MMNDISIVTDRIEQKYLLEIQPSKRQEFRMTVVEKNLDKAIEFLKSYMRVTGILSAETLPLIDIVVDKLKQESIEG